MPYHKSYQSPYVHPKEHWKLDQDFTAFAQAETNLGSDDVDQHAYEKWDWLTERQAATVEMRAIGLMTWTEIGRTMGIHYVTVKHTYNNAMAILRGERGPARGSKEYGRNRAVRPPGKWPTDWVRGQYVDGVWRPGLTSAETCATMEA